MGRVCADRCTQAGLDENDRQPQESAVREPSRRGAAAAPGDRSPQRLDVQANPKLFALEHALQIDGCDAIDAWKVAVFKDKIQPGDIVLLWQSGKKAGIYAIAEATGPVFEITVDTADEFVEPGGHKVPLRITQILEAPVSKARLLEERALAGLHILKAPFGTNFKVTAEEWAVIEPLIAGTFAVGPRGATLKEVAAETGFPEPENSNAGSTPSTAKAKASSTAHPAPARPMSPNAWQSC